MWAVGLGREAYIGRTRNLTWGLLTHTVNEVSSDKVSTTNKRWRRQEYNSFPGTQSLQSMLKGSFSSGKIAVGIRGM